MNEDEETERRFNLEGEYVEIIYRKTESERAPKVEIGFKLVVKRENISDAIDQIAKEFKHLKLSIVKEMANNNYYGSGSAPSTPEGTAPGNKRLNIRKQ